MIFLRSVVVVEEIRGPSIIDQARALKPEAMCTGPEPTSPESAKSLRDGSR